MSRFPDQNNDLKNWEGSKKSDGDRFSTHGLGKSRLKKEIKIKDGDAGNASKKFKHEYKKIISLIGKEPNLLELGIFSAMWNEHCSYKSSKKYLKTLPTKNKKVIQGPGENAGVVDIGDNDALVFKIESHNHPSFIEPYQGAATGVGGILRDVFTMGAVSYTHLTLPTNREV